LLTGEGDGRGWGRSQIKSESPVLYQSFNTLWYTPYSGQNKAKIIVVFEESPNYQLLAVFVY
jgi:hypothetical protein